VNALADLINSAADLIDERGLSLDDYRSPNGDLCPAGAIAEVLGLEPDVWTEPPDHVVDSDGYQAGFAALWLLVASLGYCMDDEAEEPWDGEMLANHIGFWLQEDRPTSAHVVGWMREVAAQQQAHEGWAA
jgi:hypothetical protein